MSVAVRAPVPGVAEQVGCGAQRLASLSQAGDSDALTIWSGSSWLGNHVSSLAVQGPPEAWDLVGKCRDRVCWLLQR